MDDIDCRRLGELLCDFVSGELDAALVVKLEAHIRRCPPCGHQVATYRLTVTMARRLPPKPVPPALMARLRDAVQQQGGNWVQ